MKIINVNVISHLVFPKRILILLGVILTCIGSWAEVGKVTLSPDPSGKISLNLTDDASGKTFYLSSPQLTDARGNLQPDFLFWDPESSSYVKTNDFIQCDYTFSYGTPDIAKLTIMPKKATTNDIKFKIKMQNPWHSELYDESEEISVTVTNEVRIPATLSAPSSICMGNTGTATVTVPDYALDADYTVNFSSSDPNILEVGSNGTLNPKAMGTATITAIVTPTTTGTASTYVASTLSTDIKVTAAPTWNDGKITITSLPLGIQTIQSENSPLIASWPEVISGLSTKYTIKSSDESIVRGHYNDSEQLVLASFKAGTANVSVVAEYGKKVWNSSEWVWETSYTATSESVAVTVNPVTGTLNVTPSSNLFLEINDDKSTGKTISYSASWSDGLEPNMSYEIDGDQIFDSSWGTSGTFILKPDYSGKTGTATVTVKSIWQKYIDKPYEEWVSVENAVSFLATVYDKTLVTNLIKPTDTNVQQGKSTDVFVSFAPSTATFQAPTSDNAKVTVAYKTVSGKTDYSTLVVTAADDATIGSEANITVTPKDGSSAEAVTFKVTVIKPTLPVTDNNSKSEIRVGETLDPTFTMGGGLVLNTDYTLTYSESENDGVINFDTTTGHIEALKVGTAKVVATYTPIEGTDAATKYDAYSQEMTIYVNPAEFALTISATVNGTSATTAKSTLTLNGTDYSGSAYTIAYSLEGAPDGVEINTTTGAITGVPTYPVQFAVVATLTPTDAINYTGATAKTAILVTDPTAKVQISVDADGVYTVNVISPGTFGEKQDDPVSNGYATLGEGASLAGLKAATSIKVTGLLANSDVRELITVIGKVVGDAYNFVNCETLDMSGAKMTEAVTATTSKCSWVEESNTMSLAGVKNVTLPTPATGVEGGTILPANTCSAFVGWYLNTLNNLETLTIPEGWTETAAKFSCYDGSGSTTFQKLTTLNLPNSLEKIGAYSFSDIRVVELFMPKNLKYIGAYAFSPTSCMQDIYFTGDGTELKYVDRTAFSSQTQLCNNSVADNQQNGKYMPTINRGCYVNGNVPVCVMHFPQGCDAQYTDVTREYKVLDTSVTPYTKGGYCYTPSGTYEDGTTWTWNSTFMNEVNSKVLDTNWGMKGTTLDGAFPDDVYGDSFIWPSQSQMTYGYGIANAGYLWNMQPMSKEQLDPENGIDKRGLYQFIVNMANAPTDKDKWVFPQKFEKDKWYTFSVPFAMSVDQIHNVFGSKTQVCRISKVIRDDSTDPNVLRLEFRNSVMEESDNRPKNTTYSDNVTQSGIRPYYPYVVKPGESVDELTAEFKEDGKRVLPDYEAVTGYHQIETIKAVDSNGNVAKDESNNELEYMFCPILTSGKIKKNSYVLANYNNKHQFVFYKGVKNAENGEYIDGGTANANTAYVQITHGASDLETFFTTSVTGGTAKFASLFGDTQDDQTEVRKVEIVCGQENVANNVIYTINGVRVNGKNLTPGLYIKNGKKFVVK